MIGLLIALVVACAIFWAARALLTAFGIGDQIATVVYVLLVLIFLGWLLQGFGGAGFPHVNLTR